jgi:hypothetical protein
MFRPATPRASLSLAPARWRPAKDKDATGTGFVLWLAGTSDSGPAINAERADSHVELQARRKLLINGSVWCDIKAFKFD